MASFDEVVPPGQAGKIKASIHTQNYSGDITKSITVEHNDASQPAVPLTVKAKVVGSVTVLPYPSLALAPRVKGFGTPAHLLLRKDPSESGTMAIEDLKASAPWLSAGLRTVSAPEPAGDGLPAAEPGDVLLSVQVGGSPPAGIHAETVTFKTGLPREPVVSIPVHVTVRAAIVLQPSDLILQPVPGDPHRATGQVSASIRDDLDPKGVSFAADDPAFVLRADGAGERIIRVTVEWSDAANPAPTQSSVQFRIGGETVSLPVRVNLGRGAAAPPDAH